MPDTATVETLTAEVRVLMVGKRQITVSVYKQLDEVQFDAVLPFGRVNMPDESPGTKVVGRHRETGALVRSDIWPSARFAEQVAAYQKVLLRNDDGKVYYLNSWIDPETAKFVHDEAKIMLPIAREWEALPLIVLAGLR